MELRSDGFANHRPFAVDSGHLWATRAITRRKDSGSAAAVEVFITATNRGPGVGLFAFGRRDWWPRARRGQVGNRSPPRARSHSPPGKGTRVAASAPARAPQRTPP